MFPSNYTYLLLQIAIKHIFTETNLDTSPLVTAQLNMIEIKTARANVWKSSTYPWYLGYMEAGVVWGKQVHGLL